jgi:hypothetical protein
VIEYVLLKDVNDTDADAQRLLALLSEVYCMINLIVFNPHEGTAFQKTDEAQVSNTRPLCTEAAHHRQWGSLFVIDSGLWPLALILVANATLVVSERVGIRVANIAPLSKAGSMLVCAKAGARPAVWNRMTVLLAGLAQFQQLVFSLALP